MAHFGIGLPGPLPGPGTGDRRPDRAAMAFAFELNEYSYSCCRSSQRKIDFYFLCSLWVKVLLIDSYWSCSCIFFSYIFFHSKFKSVRVSENVLNLRDAHWFKFIVPILISLKEKQERSFNRWSYEQFEMSRLRAAKCIVRSKPVLQFVFFSFSNEFCTFFCCLSVVFLIFVC